MILVTATDVNSVTFKQTSDHRAVLKITEIDYNGHVKVNTVYLDFKMDQPVEVRRIEGE